MIFLLPPSESKKSGGRAKEPKLSFPELDAARSLVQGRLIEVSGDAKQGQISLKLGPKQLAVLEVNLQLTKPRVMPAIDRYTGVLYDALKLDGLSKPQLSTAGQTVFIQSSLFGLISALDEIPNYRLSAGSRLPNTNLKAIWGKAHQAVWENFESETVIDLRSKAYAALAPVPEYLDAYQVEVLSEDYSGTRKALNHFNKRTKGSFVRAAISYPEKPTKLGDLKKIAKLAGIKLEGQGKTLLLITNP